MKYAKYLIGGAFAAAGFYFAMPAALSAMTLTQFVLPTAAAAVLGFVGYSPVANLFNNLFSKASNSRLRIRRIRLDGDDQPKATDNEENTAAPKVDQRQEQEEVAKADEVQEEVAKADEVQEEVAKVDEVQEEAPQADQRDVRVLQKGPQATLVAQHEAVREELTRAMQESDTSLRANLSSSSSSEDETPAQREEQAVVEMQASPILHRQVAQVQRQDELPRRSPRLEEERQKNPNYKY